MPAGINSSHTTRVRAFARLITLAAAPLHAAVDLKVDINQRSAANNIPANTAGGFTPFAITTPATGVVTGATANSLVVGAQTVTITGLTPNTVYPVTLWSWDPGSTAIPRRSTWFASDGDNGPIVRVPLYAHEGTTPPASPAERSMTFTAKSDSTGQLVIQGRKEAGYTSTATALVFLNAFIIGAPAIELPPIEITALGPWTPQGLTLTWTSQAGVRYKVEASPNLAGWTTLNDNITGLAGSTTYTDTAAAGATERFYRVSRVPQ